MTILTQDITLRVPFEDDDTTPAEWEWHVEGQVGPIVIVHACGVMRAPPQLLVGWNGNGSGKLLSIVKSEGGDDLPPAA